jgi:aminopeptidase N
MKILNSASKFAFSGSKPHYPPVLPFVIDYMVLRIEPDLESKKLDNCEVDLKISAIRDTSEIELDAVEMEITSIASLSSISIKEKKQENDKLIIIFSHPLVKGSSVTLNIKYSTGVHNDPNFRLQPRSGFHFIKADPSYPNKPLQAWTQGETIESRYWFPCIDHPLLKYGREVHVTVPSDFIVISNGIHDNPTKETIETDNSSKKVKWMWKEPNPTSTYLTSVVIGKFSEKHEDYDKGRISLYYYWSPTIDEKDAMLTFEDTPKMLEFFEDYLGTKYPYKKYAQVTVEDFEFGGMENTTCTTLNSSFLHNQQAHIDFSSDYVIAHELAHQWFGDLVTCRDWEHIWLNEGFANYCEALYWEHKYEDQEKKDEFYYYVMQASDSYFDEANTLYKRPIVTRIYKHPDEIFDGHAYEKGGCVLHMLRSFIGDDKFRNSIKNYLDKFRDSTADTNDLRQVCEEVSGIALGSFFDQWIYRSGHPKLDIEFSLDEYNNKAKIRVIQVQEEDPFEFDLDIKIFYSNNNTESTDLVSELKSLKVSEKENEIIFDIPTNDSSGKAKSVEFFSIDPNFKILKEINSIKVPSELLIRQLEDNKNTNGVERIQAVRALKDKYNPEVISALKKTILEDEFYGVSIEAANVIGGFKENSDYIRSNKAYMTIKDCLKKRGEQQLHPKIRRALVSNIGGFEKEEALELLYLYIENESYFVQFEAAAAIGKIGKNIKDVQKRKDIVERLKILSNDNSTFRNVLARGAINGLMEFSKDDEEDISTTIEKVMKENSKYGADYFKRLNAVPALSKFLRTKNNEQNKRVFNYLKEELIKDKRVRIRSLACQTLSGPDAVNVSKPDWLTIESMEILSSVAAQDIDGSVRREAETSLNKIREWIKEWSQQPMEIPIKLRDEMVKKEEKVFAVRVKRLLNME